MSTLTAHDRDILVKAWHCFKSVPEVDYKKLAGLGGYKNVASATTAYCNAKKKLLSTEAASKITDRDREFLIMAWQSFKAEPQVDYGKLSAMGNYKNKASATTAYFNTKKKLLSFSQAGEDTRSTKSAKGKRKRDDVTEDMPSETPKRKCGRKSAASQTESAKALDAAEVSRHDHDDEIALASTQCKGIRDELVDEKLSTTAENYIKQGESD